MKRFALFSIAVLAAACKLIGPEQPDDKTRIEDARLQELAKIFAELPIEGQHLHEVHDAVEASAGSGYDEEYTMECLLNAPGAGVGKTKGSSTEGSYGRPLRELIRSYFETHSSNFSTKSSVDDMMAQLAASGYQLYWPFSDNWDGKSYPVITFDPGYGAESNYGFAISVLADGTRVVDSVYVDEKVAKKRPVWVLNRNSDAGFSPIDLFDAASALTKSGGSEDVWKTQPAGGGRRKLKMKSFRMLRNYDTWFGGASEFAIKCGSVEGFNAKTEEDLKLYSPSITDFMIVVKRKYVGELLPLDVILVSDFGTQLDRVAFLVTEDDGGTQTSWKCQAQVKFNSKTYGFDLNLPYNEKDDIVWRGQLSARFFEEEDIVSGRFGDVIIEFELE